MTAAAIRRIRQALRRFALRGVGAVPVTSGLVRRDEQPGRGFEHVMTRADGVKIVCVVYRPIIAGFARYRIEMRKRSEVGLETINTVERGWMWRPVDAAFYEFGPTRIEIHSDIGLDEIGLDSASIGRGLLVDNEREQAHRPRRGDDVANWLKRIRNETLGGHSEGSSPAQRIAYMTIDRVLDSYRLHADTGTPLSERALDGGEVEAVAETNVEKAMRLGKDLRSH